jgi:hypothetical protein
VNIAEVKAYQEKISAQLQEAKAVLNGLEAHTKGKLAQSEIDAINRLKAKHQEIEKKVHQDLKTAGEVAVAAKVKTDIDSEMTKFKSSLDQLSAKVNKQPAAWTAGQQRRHRTSTSVVLWRVPNQRIARIVRSVRKIR